MVDFKQAREVAFQIVENTRNVERVSEEIDGKNGGKTTKEYWSVSVEVPTVDGIREFILEVSLKPDFPISLPVIKISSGHYELSKYLPHVDTDRKICLFDQEHIKQNTEDPAGIVNECINQAVRILSDGLNKDRLIEFNDEIIAYWENSYGENDKVVAGYLGGNMHSLEPGIVPATYLVQPHANATLYIGNQEQETQELIKFFKLRGHTVQEMDAFYLGGIANLAPPFYYNNKSLLEFIKSNFGLVWNETKSYLNRNNHLDKFIIFSVVAGDQPIFFGFYLRALKTKLKGWRTGQSTVQVMRAIRPTTAVIRVRFSEFHPERLEVRTAGKKNKSEPKKIMVAGLGSIGSHLIFYLNSLEISEYLLVDPEILVLENIARHLLSFNEVGMKKVDAFEKYLRYANPFVNILKHNGSIVELLEKGTNNTNELDFIFCAVGKDAVENYILQLLSAGTLQIPVLIFWVEPHLLGAHVLYINPGTGFSLKDLEDNGFYKYNIISPETYKDSTKAVMLREAGCQGSYMPYSKADILRFFSAFTPLLFDIMQKPPKNNMVFTYAGDLSLVNELDLQASNFSSKLSSGQILTQQL